MRGEGRGFLTMPGPSILFADGDEAAGSPAADLAPCYRDLNLDQMVADLTDGREAFELGPLFGHAAPGANGIVLRQEVFRDLERPTVAGPVRAFGEAMALVRADLKNAGTFHHPRQRDWWQLDAVLTYSRAVTALAAGLSDARPEARALAALARYIGAYAASDGFQAMAGAAEAISRDLATVTYNVRLRELKVTVLPFEGEADAGEDVARVFARFRRGAVRDYRVNIRSTPDMNHVEGQILDRVAALFPDVFGRLAALRSGPGGDSAFMDPALVAFDREAQFYLAYLDYVAPVRKVGLSLCYPEIVGPEDDAWCLGCFDLVLAHKLAADGQAAVASDWQAAGDERAFIVTGPNHGGKTTFSRALGQVHVLAALGCPVPGTSARLPAVDAVFTHFEREEQGAVTPRSKFEDDLLRIRDILESATERSLVVINEMLASTTLRDGVDIGESVIRRLLATGARFVWVTFIEDLARRRDVVSMAATTQESLASTFRVVRQPPTGLAHALALARRYGLDEDAIRRRLGA
jgi:DNA mismatch repair protein MutS